ncbi:hypothetical protein WJX74_006018 [Apatococcus lobatus]|uniref:Hflx-type G domain-containing protein n=1 Tax=Apatococcus lobatus TaxID=904363 RepID=A0AAW1Q596_9CHLO
MRRALSGLSRELLRTSTFRGIHATKLVQEPQFVASSGLLLPSYEQHADPDPSPVSVQELEHMLVVHKKDHLKKLEEGLRLAESFAGHTCPYVIVGSNRGQKIWPGTYFGSGTVKHVLEQLQSAPVSRIFVNTMLSGTQQRNLEAAWQTPVIDRIALIIAIFSKRAKSREAKLQVEMANVAYKASRLVRKASGRQGFGEGAATEVVSARQRGRSGGTEGGLGGGGGPGETEIALQRTRLQARMRALKLRLQDVRKTRELHRDARQRDGRCLVALVGYTNAGKSSLMNALSGSDIDVEDRLFATLDPTIRRFPLASGSDALLADTVGFISELPTHLIEAFKATLEEVVEADILLHVLDASSPHVLQQRETVIQVLRSLGVGEQKLRTRTFEVWNKVDLLPEDIKVPPPSEQRLRPLPIGHTAACFKEKQDICAETKALQRSEQASLAPGHCGNTFCDKCNAQERRRPTLKNLRYMVDQLAKSGQAGPAFLTAAHEGTGLTKLRQELDGKVSLTLATHQLRDAARQAGPGHVGPRLWGAPVRSKRAKRMQHLLPVGI